MRGREGAQVCVCAVSPACLYVFLVGSVVDHKFLLFYANCVFVILCLIAKQKREYTQPLAQRFTGCPMCLSRGLPRSECWGWLAPCFIENISGLFGQCIF